MIFPLWAKKGNPVTAQVKPIKTYTKATSQLKLIKGQGIQNQESIVSKVRLKHVLSLTAIRAAFIILRSFAVAFHVLICCGAPKQAGAHWIQRLLDNVW